MSNNHQSLLIAELTSVHQQIATRPNSSTNTVGMMAGLGKTFFDACSAGLQTLGGKHAPIEQAYELLMMESGPTTVDLLTQNGMLIPGWGCSFCKGEPDAVWEKLDGMLSEFTVHERIRVITDHLNFKGKKLYPNAAAYTAAVALTCGIRRELAPMLVISARLPVWGLIYEENIDRRVP